MYYKPVNLPDFDKIRQQLQNHYQRFLLINDQNWAEPVTEEILQTVCPELLQNLNELGCVFQTSVMLMTLPHGSVKLHNDMSTPWRNTAINLPVFNTANTAMNWFTVEDKSKGTMVFDPRYGNGPNVFPEENAVMLDSLELLTPHMVRIDTPHNIVNHSDFHRVILTLRFASNICHLWK